MVRPSPTGDFKHRSNTAVLILNGRPVGTIYATGWDTSWGFGEFCPNAAFSEFAPIYGMWSLLMHAEDDRDRLSRETAEELARAEALVDSIRVELQFEDEVAPVNVVALTIDGDLLEWKEF